MEGGKGRRRESPTEQIKASAFRRFAAVRFGGKEKRGEEGRGREGADELPFSCYSPLSIRLSGGLETKFSSQEKKKRGKERGREETSSRLSL